MSRGRARSTAVALALAGALLLAVPAPGAAQDWMETTVARQVSTEDSASVRIEYGAGHFTLRPADAELLYRVRARYNADRFRPLRNYSRLNGSARVRLGLASRDGEGEFDWDDLGDLDLGELGELEGEDFDESRMEVELGRGLPTDLEVLIGAAESQLQLGGLPLTGFTLTTGASEARVRFDEPNPAGMDELRVKAGAASLEVTGLGNASAREMRFESGVGELTLDFTGRWTRDATAAVKMGLGELQLRIPSDLGVELQKSTLLSSFSALGFEKADGRYRTENWEEAEHHLELTVDAAFGSIDVEVVR